MSNSDFMFLVIFQLFNLIQTLKQQNIGSKKNQYLRDGLLSPPQFNKSDENNLTINHVHMM